MSQSKPVVILFDIETAPLIATSWDLYPKYLSHDNILQDWFIICGAWKELGKKLVSAVSITKGGDDYKVVKALRQVLKDADIVVGHNLDKFDVKKLNARLIYHKLPPLPMVPTVDTLKEARKIAKFTSNRLDYLAKTLTGKGKIHVDFSLWPAAMKGDRKALKEMVEYCKMDVVRLEDVYKVLKPYMTRHPHMGVLSGLQRDTSCNTCGGKTLIKSKVRIAASGWAQQQYVCKDCGHYSTYPIKK